MARNVEIKAKIESVESLRSRVATIADQDSILIFQDDTYFSCPSGRLKLRTLSDTEGQLIFYQRPDQAGPKESMYIISPTASPDSLRLALSLAYGQAGRIRKHRTLFMADRVRIHLDKVEGLGHFLELEVVLALGESAEAGVEVARELLGRLGISCEQLVAESYVDLLASKPSECSGSSK